MPANVKGLNTLIKISRRAIDEARKALNLLEMQREALQMLAKQLAEELEREITLAIEYAGMGGFFGNYAERIRKRQEAIQQEVKTLNRRILEATNDIADKFSELKKLEIARDNRLAQAKETARLQEDRTMDEIGVRQFSRKGEGG